MPKLKDAPLASAAPPNRGANADPSTCAAQDEEEAGLGLIEYDVYVPMPPKRKYRIEVRIRERRKADPPLVAPG